ncbi:MAG: cyclic-di-AMP receptor [Chloroflexota bacterium]
MRLVIAIVRDADSETILRTLVGDGYRVTQIASTGGFLRRGNATLLVGVDKENVAHVMQIVRENSAPAIDPGQKRATVFVIKVDRLEQI